MIAIPSVGSGGNVHPNSSEPKVGATSGTGPCADAGTLERRARPKAMPDAEASLTAAGAYLFTSRIVP